MKISDNAPIRRGPKADSCPAEWLAHLRAWCQTLGPGGVTRVQTVPWGKYEALLKLRRNKVNLWYNSVSAGGGRGPVQLTRQDYLRLCPLLAAWHAYEPPTAEWKII